MRVLREVNAEELLDALDSSPRSVALLYTSDELGASALSSLAECSDLLRSADVFVCCIRSQEEAKLLQVIKLPQIRLYRRGIEERCLVGNQPLDVLHRELSDFLGSRL